MRNREGCCATWPKPCSYHEGWQDALDALRGDEGVDWEIIERPERGGDDLR